MLSINKFETRLQQYFQQSFNVKIICERRNSDSNEATTGTNECIMLKITGQIGNVESAVKNLISLLSSLNTKVFDDKTGKKR